MREYPVARREHCASCAQIEQKIRETEALMLRIRGHLHNAQMEALTNAMGGKGCQRAEYRPQQVEPKGFAKNASESGRKYKLSSKKCNAFKKQLDEEKTKS